MSPEAVLVASTVAAWAMVGLIWTIQMVHYPMLVELSALQPARAAQWHQRRISYVVGPPMAVEGVTALVLLGWRPDTMSAASAWAAAALLGVALGATILLQVPVHSVLATGHDEHACRRLLRENWIRTIAWTARGLLLAGVLAT